MVQCGEGGEEQGAFEFLVPAPARTLTTDGGPGPAGDRRDSGVGGQVGGGREVPAGAFGEDSCGS